jgi:hypothetical protein
MGREKSCRKTNSWRSKNVWARLEKGKQKLLEPLWGERECFGKFSKDGSVFACMERKQKQWQTLGKKTKVGV